MPQYLSVQEQYVPQLTQGDRKMIFQPIFLDGDQLTKDSECSVGVSRWWWSVR